MRAVSPATKRPNSKRQSSAVPQETGTQAASLVESASGNLPGERLWHRPLLAWDPSTHGDRAVTHHKVRSLLPDGAHRACALVADDVRQPAHLATETVGACPTLDAHGLDVNQDLVRTDRCSGTSS